MLAPARASFYATSPRKDPLGPGPWENYISLIRPAGHSRSRGWTKVLRGGSSRAPFTWEENNPDGMHETPVHPGAREYVAMHPYTHFDLGFRVALSGVWKDE